MIELERKNYLLFVCGKLISIFGSSIYTFTLSFYVLELTGSALNFATIMVLGIVPMIITNPFAGVIADRFDKKSTIIIMDLANGILLFSLYALSQIYYLNLTMIYVSTFIMTIFTSIFGVTFEAAKPNIVSENMILTLNSTSKIIDSVSQILGPMVGGLVFAFVDIKVFILANSISFIISGISEFFIDFDFNLKENILKKSKSNGKINFKKDIFEGVDYITANPYIKSLFGVFICINFFLGFSITIPMPYIINKILKLGSLNFGIIEGAFPVGMIIGALLVKRFEKKINYIKSISYMMIMLSVCMILTGFPILIDYLKYSNQLYTMYYSILMVLLGIIVSFIDIPLFCILQRRIPNYILGRVLSIGISGAKLFLPIALILSGIIVEQVSAYIIAIVGGTIFFLISFVTFRNLQIYV